MHYQTFYWFVPTYNFNFTFSYIFTFFSENDPETVMLKNGLNATPKKIITKKAAKPKKPKKPIFKRGPRTNKKVGITNSGNNCFMNAIWQVLR
jgi:ubiquitin C-terminal hydrolase